jgi:hypothetical protein
MRASADVENRRVLARLTESLLWARLKCNAFEANCGGAWSPWRQRAGTCGARDTVGATPRVRGTVHGGQPDSHTRLRRGSPYPAWLGWVRACPSGLTRSWCGAVCERRGSRREGSFAHARELHAIDYDPNSSRVAQPFEKAGFAEGKSLDFPSSGFGFSFLRLGLSFRGIWRTFPAGWIARIRLA